MLSKLGNQYSSIIADLDKNNVNGSAPGNDNISLANFTVQLFDRGELVSDNIAILQALYGFGIDNISGGKYKAHFIWSGLPTQLELWIKHSTDMLAWRKEEIDVQFSMDAIGEIMHNGNTSYEYVRAVVQDAVRKVAIGKLDYVIIRMKRDTDLDWSLPVSTQTLWAWYASLGDDNPQRMGEDG